MLPHHPPVTRADGAGGFDEIARTNGEHGAPNDARVVRDVHDADGDHRGEQAPTKDRDDPDREKQIREGQEHVHRTHDEAVGSSAVVRGGHAQKQTRHQRDARDDPAGLQRHPRAPDNTAEHVTAELVCSHEVGCARGLALDTEILVDPVVGAHLPGEDRHEPEEHQQSRSEHSGRGAQEAPARRYPQGWRRLRSGVDR